jgi:ketosteroid isomerase-like protein
VLERGLVGKRGALEPLHLACPGYDVGVDPNVLRVWSQRDDVTLANPFGPARRGWAQVAETMERASSNWKDGEVVGFENVAKYVTPELAYIGEAERFKAKVGGAEEITPVALRTTTVLRPEDGTWKVMHRHADPITTAQAAESVVQK